MSDLGPKTEVTARKRDVRSSPESRHCPPDLSGPFRADIVAKVPKGAAANFPPKNETSENRRSIGLRARYQNRP
jgi:hypothetical protein